MESSDSPALADQCGIEELKFLLVDCKLDEHMLSNVTASLPCVVLKDDAAFDEQLRSAAVLLLHLRDATRHPEYAEKAIRNRVPLVIYSGGGADTAVLEKYGNKGARVRSYHLVEFVRRLRRATRTSSIEPFFDPGELEQSLELLSDLWAVALTWEAVPSYEITTGIDSITEIIEDICSSDPEPTSPWGPEPLLSEVLIKKVRRCAKPADLYHLIEQLRDALLLWAEKCVRERPEIA